MYPPMLQKRPTKRDPLGSDKAAFEYGVPDEEVKRAGVTAMNELPKKVEVN